MRHALLSAAVGAAVLGWTVPGTAAEPITLTGPELDRVVAGGDTIAVDVVADAAGAAASTGSVARSNSRTETIASAANVYGAGKAAAYAGAMGTSGPGSDAPSSGAATTAEVTGVGTGYRYTRDYTHGFKNQYVDYSVSYSIDVGTNGSPE